MRQAQAVGVVGFLILLELGSFGAQSIAAAKEWHLTMSDPGSGDWTANWFVWGAAARGVAVITTPGGMILRAGDGSDSRADHSILWSKRAFSGDLRVEYDITVMDNYTTPIPARGYCSALLLYSQGTAGTGYPSDLFAWAPAQHNPNTSGRFLNKNLRGLQLNYAFVGDSRGNRLRLRSNPGYDLVGESGITSFFKKGATYHMNIEKTGGTLSVTVTDHTGATLSHVFADISLTAHTSGRIGLRNMNRREARYSEIRVYHRE